MTTPVGEQIGFAIVVMVAGKVQGDVGMTRLGAVLLVVVTMVLTVGLLLSELTISRQQNQIHRLDAAVAIDHVEVQYALQHLLQLEQRVLGPVA